MKLSFIFFLFLGIVLGFTFQSKADQTHSTVYVWDFSTRDRVENDLTWSLTDEFDAALVNSAKYTVLDRRSKDRWARQAGREAAITQATDIPTETKSELHLDTADMVVFGEIFDDVDSGVVTVTVTFENWKDQKRLVKEVDIPRGKINDVPTRLAAMEALVQKIGGQTAPILKVESHSFLIEIKKCQAQGEEVKVEMSICNNDDVDRTLMLITMDGAGHFSDVSRMIDNNGNEINAYYARVSNHEGEGGIRSMLASGIPVKCALAFKGVPRTATALARLTLVMSGANQGFDLTIRNVPIERAD